MLTLLQEIVILLVMDLTQPYAYTVTGNRDIVGYGFNGNPTYIDREEWPAPAVRFKENTTEVEALRVKEKGDWKLLTLDEKKECKSSAHETTDRNKEIIITCPTANCN